MLPSPVVGIADQKFHGHYQKYPVSESLLYSISFSERTISSLSSLDALLFTDE